jgi:hypothetical protein
MRSYTTAVSWAITSVTWVSPLLGPGGYLLNAPRRALLGPWEGSNRPGGVVSRERRADARSTNPRRPIRRPCEGHVNRQLIESIARPLEPKGQIAVVVSAGNPLLWLGEGRRGQTLQRRLAVCVRGRVRVDHDCGPIRLGGRGCAAPGPQGKTGRGRSSLSDVFRKSGPRGECWGAVGAHPRVGKNTRHARSFPRHAVACIEAPDVSNAKNYRRYAAECLELAGTVSDPHARASLAHMAEVWLRLAHEKDADRVKDTAD